MPMLRSHDIPVYGDGSYFPVLAHSKSNPTNYSEPSPLGGKITHITP